MTPRGWSVAHHFPSALPGLRAGGRPIEPGGLRLRWLELVLARPTAGAVILFSGQEGVTDSGVGPAIIQAAVTEAAGRSSVGGPGLPFVGCVAFRFEAALAVNMILSFHLAPDSVSVGQKSVTVDAVASSVIVKVVAGAREALALLPDFPFFPERAVPSVRKVASQPVLVVQVPPQALSSIHIWAQQSPLTATTQPPHIRGATGGHEGGCQLLLSTSVWFQQVHGRRRSISLFGALRAGEGDVEVGVMAMVVVAGEGLAR